MKNWKLTKNTMEHEGIKLLQIQCIKTFTPKNSTERIESGQLGGWIQKKENLSEDAWVFEDVKVLWNSQVLGGTIKGGTILGGTILGGTIWGSTIRDGTIEGGTIEGGTIKGGTIKGGTIEGGTIKGGTILGGTIWGGTIKDDAIISGNVHIKFGTTDFDVKTNLGGLIRNSLGICAVLGVYTFYKKVNKTENPNIFQSCYDSNFLYKLGVEKRPQTVDENWENSCSSGLHCSTPDYWNEGDTLLAVSVKVEDVITCQEGKVRCRALTPVCVVE